MKRLGNAAAEAFHVILPVLFHVEHCFDHSGKVAAQANPL
ncbi:hypothetical protein SAMN06295900_117100 [Trinickia caryophylli]|uniref:Uncharacterized protein n=1 Tax=Trinickia caryophylli TaxID=28094 RepID=A0A1X7GR07_TRICW|nr:hypothetical protein SAMN06295900_117100 [Trinickia caryophylli]